MRGATQKTATLQDAGAERVPVTGIGEVAVETFDNGAPPAPAGADAVTSGDDAPIPAAPWDQGSTGAAEPEAPKRRTPFPELDATEQAQVVSGQRLALGALEASVAVADRSTGRLLWASDAWLDRFGFQAQIGRYMATATDLGESPLPGPGEVWQRTRSVLCADGSEDLAELLLLGERTDRGQDVVTLVAVERSGATSVVTDRSEVMSIIDGALDEAEVGSVAVLYVDLDRFKVVHDLVGSLEARRILDVVARRLGGVVRASDLVFRLASDEFVVLCCELEHAGTAKEVAERLRQAVASLPGHGHDLALTASVGVVVSSEDATGESMMSAAETAVYLAKGRGRNRVAIHDEELRNRSQRLLTVERQLRRAIEQRDVGFAYQPLVHLASGMVLGAEALLRLGGEIGLSAVEVVAAAEHSGLMGSLGSLVLEGVDEQLGHLLRRPDHDLLLMVNLSATQLADEGLNSLLEKLAADEDIRPGRLAVEVPEIVVRENPKAFAELAARIRPRLKLGIDGFGTNYDSTARLDIAGIDYVKLHRSLTATIGTEHDSRAEIGDLLAAARTRQISVVALGVERQDQAMVLTQLGCSMAQGFLFAGAVRAAELEELLRSGFEESVP